MALVQRQGDVEKAANVIFWTNSGLALLIYTSLFVFSQPIALIFGDSRVAPVLQVLGIQIILSALSAVHIALYRKSLDFKRLFWVRLLTTALPATASVPLAYFGMGYWALVAGTLTGAAGQLVVLWQLSPWRPRLEYDGHVAGELFRFGTWAAAGSLLGWFHLWTDSLIVGAYLGSRELGLYRAGYSLVSHLFMLLVFPFVPVLFSVLSKLQSDFAALRHALLKAVKLISMVSLPVGLGLFVVREPLAQLVFGQKWEGISIVIGVMGLIDGMGWVVYPNPEAYRAIGRPDLETKLSLFSFLPYLIAYFIAIPFGLEVFLWVRFCVLILLFPIEFYLARRYLAIKIYDYYALLFRLVIASLGMFCFAFMLLNYFLVNMSDFVKLVVVMPTAAMLYFVLLFSLEKQSVLEVWSLLRSKNL
jgi:O-antigen/teichoic acid export membrane protein